jgi:hypothetical protein
MQLLTFVVDMGNELSPTVPITVCLLLIAEYSQDPVMLRGKRHDVAFFYRHYVTSTVEACDY